MFDCMTLPCLFLQLCVCLLEIGGLLSSRGVTSFIRSLLVYKVDVAFFKKSGTHLPPS